MLTPSKNAFLREEIVLVLVLAVAVVPSSSEGDDPPRDLLLSIGSVSSMEEALLSDMTASQPVSHSDSHAVSQSVSQSGRQAGNLSISQ